MLSNVNNCHSFEVVDRVSETQLQGGESGLQRVNHFAHLPVS